MLSCESAREEIDVVLDDGLAPGTDLEGHLKNCAVCRAHLESIKQLEQRLRNAARPSRQTPFPAPALPSASEAVVHRTPKTRFAAFWLSAACLLFACACIATYFAAKAETVAENAVPPVRIAPNPEQPAADSLNSLLADPDKALLSERENLLTDIRSVESFLLRCLPAADSQKRG